MKKFIAFTLSLWIAIQVTFAQQVLYSQKFNALTLTTVTNGSSSFLFSNLPSNMKSLNVGSLTNNASTGAFAVSPYNTAGWHAFKYLQDTVAVSCSWTTTNTAVDKWLITPTISNITANTLLSWEAMAEDAQSADGYEVWVTTSASANPQASDFTSNPSNRLLVITAENSDGFQLRGVSLAQFAGQTIRVGFRNNSTQKYLLMIDDIQVKTGYPTIDGALLNVDIPNYVALGQKPLKITLQNTGLTPATSMEVKYQIDGGSVITELATFPQALGYGEKYDYTFNNLASFSPAGTRVLTVWITKVNNTADTNTGNNTQTSNVAVLSSIPTKKTLVRQFTGTWGGYCPDGDYKIAQLKAQYPNKVVALAIHDNDGMSNMDGDEWIFNYMDGASFPSATIDDKYFEGETAVPISRDKWADNVAKQLSSVSPVKISLANQTFNTTTRKLDVDVKVEFFINTTGNYRVNLYLVEDSVTGTGSAFSQTNAFNSQQSSPFYNKGNPIVGYVHNNVFLGALGGTSGSSGVIPTSVTANMIYTKHYSVTLPAQTSSPKMWKAKNIRLIAVVNEYNSSDLKKRNILNVEEAKLIPSTTTELEAEALGLNDLKLYPNPATTEANLLLSFAEPTPIQAELYDLNGKLVQTLATPSQFLSDYEINFSTAELNAGLYIVKIAAKDKILCEKLWISK